MYAKSVITTKYFSDNLSGAAMHLQIFKNDGTLVQNKVLTKIGENSAKVAVELMTSVYNKFKPSSLITFELISDDSYITSVVCCCRKWRREGFITKEGEPIKNVSLIEEYLEAYSRLNCSVNISNTIDKAIINTLKDIIQKACISHMATIQDGEEDLECFVG